MEKEQISACKMRGMRFQYWMTATIATVLGLVVMFIPEITKEYFMFKEQDQVVFGISGAVYFAFGVLSILGIRNPLKWLPILLLQFTYKVTWFIGVIGLLAVRGELDIRSSIWLICGYAVFVAGDIWAIPFRYVLANDDTGS
jgi:hypothetical protein